MKKETKKTISKVLAVLGGVAVTAGAIFSVMWFIPGIHDKVWPDTTTQIEQEQDKDNTNTETDNE